MPSGGGLYSRVVAVLKVGLPLVALGLISALFLVQTDDRIGGELTFTEGDMEALGSGLRISNPTFTGASRGGDRFRFTADQVVPDAAPPTRADITALAGEVALHDGPAVALTAAAGALDIADQRLVLRGDVDIETSDGYRMRTDRLTIDLRSGSLAAEAPVATQGPLGQIDAGSLKVAPASDAGEARRFSFGNGVRVVYDPPPEE
jgi:lipopolysaccharide export system protein LptC